MSKDTATVYLVYFNNTFHAAFATIEDAIYTIDFKKHQEKNEKLPNLLESKKVVKEELEKLLNGFLSNRDWNLLKNGEYRGLIKPS